MSLTVAHFYAWGVGAGQLVTLPTATNGASANYPFLSLDPTEDYYVDWGFGALTVTNKALTSNVATLTLSAEHGLAVDDVITVAGVDSTFNGSYTVTAVTWNTVSYAKTHADVGSASASGTVVAYTPFTTDSNGEATIGVKYPIAGSYHIVVRRNDNGQAVIADNQTVSLYGTIAAAAAPVTHGQDEVVNFSTFYATDAYRINWGLGTRTLAAKKLVSNTATISAAGAHGYRVDDVVTVAGVDSTFNGTYTITAVSDAAGTAGTGAGVSANNDLYVKTSSGPVLYKNDGNAVLPDWTAVGGSIVTGTGDPADDWVSGTGYGTAGVGDLYIKTTAGPVVYVNSSASLPTWAEPAGTLRSGAGAPTNGVTDGDTGDYYSNTTAYGSDPTTGWYICTDGATDTWVAVSAAITSGANAPVDSAAGSTNGSTGQYYSDTDAYGDDPVTGWWVCTDGTLNSWAAVAVGITAGSGVPTDGALGYTFSYAKTHADVVPATATGSSTAYTPITMVAGAGNKTIKYPTAGAKTVTVTHDTSGTLAAQVSLTVV